MHERVKNLIQSDGRVKIAPSVLAADFGDLRAEVQAAEQGGADLMHLDVMDGHFVPNLTIGPDVVRTVREAVDIPVDAHLMISHPLDYIERFAKAGADIICFHVESEGDASETATRIRELGALACVTLNPETPVEVAASCMEACDMALVMTVHPGFGGQTFMEEQLPKVSDIRSRWGLPVAVDGGVGIGNARLCAEAGASILVAGTAVFRSDDRASAIEGIRSAAGPVRAPGGR
jgi:ribulose-phosphate 3-epimerase